MKYKAKRVVGSGAWMTRNLDVENYRNGDVILHIEDRKDWLKTRKGAWCWYNNDPKLGQVYGKLYNWYAVNDPRGLAPEGWHVPSISEWDVLVDALGGEEEAGGKLKAKGRTHWVSPNPATNKSGLSLLGGGYRRGLVDGSLKGSFDELKRAGQFWTATKRGWGAWMVFVDNLSTDFNKHLDYKTAGHSVLCVKDD